MPAIEKRVKIVKGWILLGDGKGRSETKTIADMVIYLLFSKAPFLPLTLVCIEDDFKK